MEKRTIEEEACSWKQQDLWCIQGTLLNTKPFKTYQLRSGFVLKLLDGLFLFVPPIKAKFPFVKRLNLSCTFKCVQFRLKVQLRLMTEVLMYS